jgi:hypothetical protein
MEEAEGEMIKRRAENIKRNAEIMRALGECPSLHLRLMNVWHIRQRGILYAPLASSDEFHPGVGIKYR